MKIIKNRNIGAAIAATVTFAGSLLLAPTEAGATHYQVNSSTPDLYLADGLCSFREAVIASNTRRALSGCPAGDAEYNTIEIQGSAPVELTSSDPIEITSSISVWGAALPSSRVAIHGGNTRIVIRPGGQLYLENLRLSRFDVTPLHLFRGFISGRGYVRGMLVMTAVEISGNDGQGTTNQSPSIDSYGGEVLMNSCVIRDNIGGIKGGGIYSHGSATLLIRNSAIVNNVVSQYGGAIVSIEGSTAFLYNVTISGNTASLAGGGVYNSGGPMEMWWTTITNNKGSSGQGIHATQSGTVTVYNSIVSGNGLADCNGVVSSGGYNLLNQCPGAVSVSTDVRGQTAQLDALTSPTSWPFTPVHYPQAGGRSHAKIPHGGNGCGGGGSDQHYVTRTAPCDIGAIQRH